MTRHAARPITLAWLLPLSAAWGAAQPELSEQAAPSGSLAIQAVQRTPGAAAIGVAGVTVQLYHQGMVLQTIESQLDEHGVVMLDGLPLGVPMQPVVQVLYSDLTYRKVGAVMDAAHPEQAIEVECYEPTDVEPDWSVSMWHVMADRGPDGLVVTEVVVVQNPGDRTWVGRRPSVDGDAREVTTQFMLPERANHVALQRGFHDWCCTSRDGRRLANHLPLMPGSTEFRFSYHVTGAGATDLELAAPAPVDHMMLLVSDQLDVVSSGGLTAAGSENTGGRTIAAFNAMALDAGTTIPVMLSVGPPAIGQVTGTQLPSAATDGSGAVGLARLVAGVGGGVLVLAALVVVLRPRRSSALPETRP